MIAMVLAGGIALIVSLGLTPLLIRFLQARGIGQPIHDDVTQHAHKAGTPTMGGITMVAGALIGYVAAHLREGAVFTRGGLLVVFAIVGGAVIGFLDDYLKITSEENRGGLNKRSKMAGQLLVALVFVYFAINWAHVSTTLSFTRFDLPGWELGAVGWGLLALLVLSGSNNATNFTDGLDGLLAGSSAFAFGTLAIIGFWQLRYFDIYRVPQSLDLALIAVAMVGGCAGFLWWNAAPARIIMGDTGSNAIGGGLAGLSMVMNLHLLLPIIGALFVLEALSVVIQIGSFRGFNRRVFRMAPIHHHFEQKGWPETTVLIRFWILAGLSTALALGIFYADFLSTSGIE